MYQVTQQKKAKKWECKVCHSSQSIKQIFGTSNKASDLRPKVQDYNMKLQQSYTLQDSSSSDSEDSKDLEVEDLHSSDNLNKWEEFVEEPREEKERESDEEERQEDELCLQNIRKKPSSHSQPYKRKRKFWWGQAPNSRPSFQQTKQRKLNQARVITKQNFTTGDANKKNPSTSSSQITQTTTIPNKKQNKWEIFTQSEAQSKEKQSKWEGFVQDEQQEYPNSSTFAEQKEKGVWEEFLEEQPQNSTHDTNLSNHLLLSKSQPNTQPNTDFKLCFDHPDTT